MELNHLRYFREVARTENISKAAKALFITQPALSVTIKRLETELGYDLFRREGNKIKLTEAGSCYLSYVNSAFSILEEGAAKGKQIAEQDDQVLRVSSGFGILRVMTDDYLKEHTDAKIEVKCVPTDEIVSRLVNGRADIGLVMNPVSDSRLESRVIMTGGFFVCVNEEHPLARSEGGRIRMKDLEGQLLFCSNIAQTYQTASRILKKAGVNCNLLTLDEREVLFSAADKGLGGVFCMPMRMTSEQAKGDNLVWLAISDCSEAGHVIMLRKRDTFYSEEHMRYIRFLERRFSENERYLREQLGSKGIAFPEE